MFNYEELAYLRKLILNRATGNGFNSYEEEQTAIGAMFKLDTMQYEKECNEPVEGPQPVLKQRQKAELY